MSFRKLDEKGKPIPTDGRSTRKPATKMCRGKTLTHYEIFLTLTGDDGKRKDIRKRFWLADGCEAAFLSFIDIRVTPVPWDELGIIP